MLVRSKVLRDATPATMMFASLMAALVHDVSHVGRTNHFLVNTQHELAVKYNDQSVLENMHIAVAMEIATDPMCNIFEHFGHEVKKEVRSVWITMILGKFFIIFFDFSSSSSSSLLLNIANIE